MWDHIRFLRCIGKVSYEIDFPNDLTSIHLVFHVSLLKKCVSDLTYIVPLKCLGINESLSYEDVLVEIFVMTRTRKVIFNNFE
ncbi:hypothetical protein MTR67_017904 [Solanum verrucosum]|uniref:Tf2-1-like SH3-like domain-containing protein n=1 Tax=Solanum verrucosum TaxID=315347 RepID=A0AAF0TM84_SOLVR|nr:hypothetical protein MTR67_017904 [Solanum verrucosum]